MNISLTPELEHFVAARVRSGEYGSSSEVIKDSLRLLEAAEEFRTTKLNPHMSAEEAFKELWQAKLRGAIEEGMKGPSVDADEAFRIISSRLSN